MKFLDPIEKVELVREWQEKRQLPRPKGRDLAGSGYPDPEVFDLTDRINELAGVCTHQSCAGHPRTETRKWSAPGQLWLRLSEPVFYRVLENIEALTFCAPITAREGKPFCENPDHWDVRFHFNPDGGVLDIKFPGLDAGPEALAKSAERLVEFFTRIVKRLEPFEWVDIHHPGRHPTNPHLQPLNLLTD